MYVIGKTGVGKTSLLEFMIRQDVVNGAGVAVFDPHGDLVERILEWLPQDRREKLLYIDVPNPTSTFSFNPLANVPKLRRSVAANGIVESFKKLFVDSWGVRLEY